MEKRYCVYVPETAYVEGKGFIPSVVREDEAGHTPLMGRGELAQPWFWGPTIEDAQRQADEYNTALGLTEEDVVEIVTSSMRAENINDARRDEYHRLTGSPDRG